MDKANRNTGKAATEDEIGVCDVSFALPIARRGGPRMQTFCVPFGTQATYPSH